MGSRGWRVRVAPPATGKGASVSDDARGNVHQTEAGGDSAGPWSPDERFAGLSVDVRNRTLMSGFVLR